MASIQANFNKDGQIISYRYRACIGRDEKGKQKFATKTEKVPEGYTPKKLEKEMQRRADAWEVAIKKGLAPVKKQTLRYFVNEIWWPLHVQNGEHKQTTIEFYRHMSTRILDRFGNRDLASIKAVDIERFLNDLRAEGLSGSSIKHHQNVLRIMFQFAENHDLIEKNPMRKVAAVKVERSDVDFLDPDQAKAFLKALESAPLRWRCMMNLLIFNGLRRGEAVGLQWADIDFNSGLLSVNRSVSYTSGGGVIIGTPKSKNSVRTLPISAPVLALLREWKQEQATLLMPSAFVFPSDTDPFEPMFPTAPTRWLSRFVKANNLPNVSPHDLRHTCGSLMLASGASIKETQDFLGHEDASTTLKFYTGSTPEGLRKASESLAAVLQ